MNPNVLLLPVAGFRAARLLAHILYAILIACIYPALTRPARLRIMRNWSLDLLHILNVRWHADGRQTVAPGGGRLFIANHISWLDVFAMNAVVPARFIAKSEVGRWPLVGWLSRRTGALFIRRDMLRDTARVNRLVCGMLQQGESIALFPEGTSTDGSQHVSFNPALLQGAIDAGAAIHPMAVHYHDGSGKRVGDAAFIGDMTFLHSLGRILFSSSLHVTVACLPALDSSGNNRRALALAAEAAVNAALDRHPGDAFHQLLTSPSCCGNNASLNSLPVYLGDDDAEPDPAATPAA